MIYQEILNGQVVGPTSAATDDNGQAKTKSQMNETKEMFLKLLVAEMQYQDPMQPTDNSEYVKELSQFTQVETLNSVNDQVEQLSAQSLAGKYVTLVDEDTGKQVEGRVDFVTTNAGENYVSVDGVLYKSSTIVSVADGNYFEEVTMANNVTDMINNLPDPARLTLSDSEKVSNVAAVYDNLSQNAKQHVPQEAIDRMTEIISKLNEMKQRQAEIDAAKEKEAAASTEAPQSTGGTEESQSSQENTSAAVPASDDGDANESLESTEDNTGIPEAEA